MPASSLSLVFFGTGPVSAATLEGIADAFTIEAVVTKPRMTAPGGKPLPHPVLDLAEARDWPVVIVRDKHELADVFTQHRFESQVGLVVDFGIIIPSQVIEYFPRGILNSHFSLLPLLRGADPISPIILHGLSETGVSLMTIVPALDAGDLLCQEHFLVPAGMTTPELTDALVGLSNKVIQSTVPAYVSGSVKPYPQDPTVAPTYTRKLSKADGVIDWGLPAERIERQIRAYLGWPGSRATIAGRDVTITRAHVAGTDTPLPKPGDYSRTANGELIVGCGNGTGLVIDALKPAGRSEMSSKAFLSGLR